MTRAPLFLLSLLLSFPLSAASRLSLGISYQGSTSVPRGTLRFEPMVINDGPEPARNVVLTVPVPPETTVESISMRTGGWECGERGGAVVCTTPLLPVAAPQRVTILFRTPVQSAGGYHPLRISLAADDVPRQETLVTVTIARTLRVTASSDAGPGSLRQAIVDANAQCLDANVPCHVAFELPKPATIEPLTPLPAITACAVHFDAGSDVELSGARVSRGSGLEIDSPCGGMGLTGFTINRFPENGIFIRHGSAGIHNAQIGTDLTGEEARPNGMRGIVIADANAVVVIDGSIISGNRLSGIFAVAARYVMLSAGVGLSRRGHPLPNGASGVFLARGALSFQSGTIAHHPQFGIAVLPGAGVAIHPRASIHSNQEAAIDYNLDRRTPNDQPDRDGVPNAPELTDAFYDAASNTTVVRGVHRGGPSQLHRVAIFANRGDAELERFVAQRQVTSGSTFELHVAGDLRGELLTAVSQSAGVFDAPDWTTSEVSEGITIR